MQSTYLSQHMLVILWTDSWTRAWACSCSMNWESSCCRGVRRGSAETAGRTHLGRVVELVHGRCGTLTGEAGYVEDDETREEKPPSEPRASCPSLSSDGHGSCKPRVPHLTPFPPQSPSLSLPSWPPPPHGPQTSPSNPPTPTSGSQTNAPRTSPTLRRPMNAKADRILSLPRSVQRRMSPGRPSP